jgi:ABC-2 type transport system ATP-binding protein
MTRKRTVPSVRARNLGRRFGRRSHALHDVTFDVDAGSCVGVVGPNGSGKTTLLRCVAGLLAPSEGEITVDTAGPIGFLPQDAQPPPAMTPLAFLRYLARVQGLREPATEVARLLQAFGLHASATTPCSRLSTGLRRRVALAQALLGAPALVVLDEPTAGLDPIAARDLRDLLRELRGETTILLSSHDLRDVADICTHVAFLQDGTIARFAPLQTLSSEADAALARTANGSHEQSSPAWTALVGVIERELVRGDRSTKEPQDKSRTLAARG